MQNEYYLVYLIQLWFIHVNLYLVFFFVNTFWQFFNSNFPIYSYFVIFIVIGFFFEKWATVAQIDFKSYGDRATRPTLLQYFFFMKKK